jgi:hypothetical protein
MGDRGGKKDKEKGQKQNSDKQQQKAKNKVERPAGVLAVWSAGPDRAFTKRLCQAGFEINEVCVRARRSGAGGRHTIWIAVRGS